MGSIRYRCREADALESAVSAYFRGKKYDDMGLQETVERVAEDIRAGRGSSSASGVSGSFFNIASISAVSWLQSCRAGASVFRGIRAKLGRMPKALCRAELLV